MEKRWDPMLWDTFAEAVQTEQLAPKYHSLASVLPYPCFSAAWARHRLTPSDIALVLFCFMKALKSSWMAR